MKKKYIVANVTFGSEPGKVLSLLEISSRVTVNTQKGYICKGISGWIEDKHREARWISTGNWYVYQKEIISRHSTLKAAIVGFTNAKLVAQL